MVDPVLLEHVQQLVTPRVETIERRIGRLVPALEDDHLDELLADQVLDGWDERGTWRADDAVRRPRVEVVGGRGDVVRGVLVIVA